MGGRTTHELNTRPLIAAKAPEVVPQELASLEELAQRRWRRRRWPLAAARGHACLVWIGVLVSRPRQLSQGDRRKQLQGLFCLEHGLCSHGFRYKLLAVH